MDEKGRLRTGDIQSAGKAMWQLPWLWLGLASLHRLVLQFDASPNCRYIRYIICGAIARGSRYNT